MKKTLLFSSLLLIMGINAPVHADVDTTSSYTPSAATDMDKSDAHLKKHRPCMHIATACETAGYRLSHAVAGKNIWKDCVRPILDGQSIAGVTADPADIDACKERKAKWKMNHEMNKMEKASETVAPANKVPTIDSSEAQSSDTPNNQ